MADRLPTRAECIRAARAALDRARVEAAADYAAGRMTGQRLAAYERARAKYAAKRAAETANAEKGATAPLPSRAECIAAFRAVAASVLTRLAIAEAEGRLTPEEAEAVAQMRGDARAAQWRPPRSSPATRPPH